MSLFLLGYPHDVEQSRRIDYHDDGDDDDEEELKSLLQLGDLAATLLDASDMGGDKETELHQVVRPDITKMLP